MYSKSIIAQAISSPSTLPVPVTTASLRFVFSLALVHNGKPIVGVVYDVNEDKMYYAIKGEGAYCNDIRIHVNDKKLGELGKLLGIITLSICLSEALIIVHLQYQRVIFLLHANEFE